MKVMVINGNPKPSGFIAGSLDIIAKRLQERGADVQRLNLREAHIGHCLACFACLKTGQCVQDDDMSRIIADLQTADGYVVGSPVRNSSVTALYKQYYERITYPLGFPLLLDDKYVLAICSVGGASGAAVNREMLGMRGMGVHLSGYIFRAVGMPNRVQPEDLRPRYEQAADKLITNIETRRPRDWQHRMRLWTDRVVCYNFMFKKNPEAFANVLAAWKAKGYLK